MARTPIPEAGLVSSAVLVAGLVLVPARAQAIGTTFSFNLGSSTATPTGPLAAPSKTFTTTNEGRSLTLSFQNALRPNGNAKPVSATVDGLCIYKAGGAGLNDIGRSNCGRRNPGNGSGVANQSAMELFFDQQVELLGYRYGSLRVGRGNPLLTWGAPNGPVVSTETLFDKQIDTFYSFTNPFIVQANQILSISGIGGGRGTSSTEALLSGLVVRAFPQGPPATESVPGPLPLLGAMAAFGWSRRLRLRLNHNAAAVSPCDRDGSEG